MNLKITYAVPELGLSITAEVSSEDERKRAMRMIRYTKEDAQNIKDGVVTVPDPNGPATEKQLNMIHHYYPDLEVDFEILTYGEARDILDKKRK